VTAPARWLVVAVAAIAVAAAACTPADVSPAAGDPTPHQQAGPLRYVALGDSLATGVGEETTYVDVFARHLGRVTGQQVDTTNLGRAGWTSGQLLAALTTDDTFRDAVAQANVVTWDIGGNDLLIAAANERADRCAPGMCLHRAVHDFESNWEAIVAELIALRSGPDTRMLTFDLYEPFVAPAAPPVPRGGRRALQAVNRTIRATGARAGFEVGRVTRAFREGGAELIAADGIHPSPAGHRAIAEALADAWRRPLP